MSRDLAPRSEEELLLRARGLAGRTLHELASALGQGESASQRRDKGATGSLIERALGIARSARSEPDLPALGIEIKTLPVIAGGRVLESTFVCRVPTPLEPRWAGSRVASKLARVLWVPVEGRGERDRRRVGSPFLWSPSPALEEMLESDHADLCEALAHAPERVSARIGRALQVRPKAAHGAIRALRPDEEGSVWVVPRAFYLRRWVTEEAIARAELA